MPPLPIPLSFPWDANLTLLLFGLKNPSMTVVPVESSNFPWGEGPCRDCLWLTCVLIREVGPNLCGFAPALSTGDAPARPPELTCLTIPYLWRLNELRWGAYENFPRGTGTCPLPCSPVAPVLAHHPSSLLLLKCKPPEGRRLHSTVYARCLHRAGRIIDTILFNDNKCH